MSDRCWDLAVEIGGTKLQWAVGRPGEPWCALERRSVVPEEGAQGILRQLAEGIEPLTTQWKLRRVGVGFGGPVDVASGRVTTSHQIRGWDGFELAKWFQEVLGLPATVANDCDTAALGEATLGAGRGARRVFYVTVGSGIGGGFVQEGRIYGTDRPAASEIGHLRPGTGAEDARQTVESVASGWGLARQAVARMNHPALADRPADVADLRQRAGGKDAALDARMLAEAAQEGNRLAASVIADGVQMLGWAIAQVITLLAPDVVVVGGGVSLMGEDLFWKPLREQVRKYVFPPLTHQAKIVPAGLGEEVVLHGALLLPECA